MHSRLIFVHTLFFSKIFSYFTHPALLSQYCDFHVHGAACSEKEKREWDARLLRLDTAELCELAAAAYHLEITPLVELTCKGIATLMQGKSPEEIRRIFALRDDDEATGQPFPGSRVLTSLSLLVLRRALDESRQAATKDGAAATSIAATAATSFPKV